MAETYTRAELRADLRLYSGDGRDVEAIVADDADARRVYRRAEYRDASRRAARAPGRIIRRQPGRITGGRPAGRIRRARKASSASGDSDGPGEHHLAKAASA